MTAGNDAYTSDVAVSPDGSTVAMTGSIYSGASGNDIVTMAFDATTGGRRWVAQYDARHGDDFLAKVLVSTDNSTIYVIGDEFLGSHGYDMVVLAYDASTGRIDWSSRYRSLGGREDIPYDASLSRDGSRLFVLGSAGMADVPFDADLVAFALDTAGGGSLWRVRMGRSQTFTEHPGGLAVSNDGSSVFISGSAPAPGGGERIETIALDGATGARVWMAATARRGAHFLSDMALTPDGSTIVETGAAAGGTSDRGLVLALDASNGHLRWIRTFLPSDGVYGTLYDVDLSPDGSVVYAAGILCTTQSCDPPRFMSLVAFAVAGGTRLWTARVGMKSVDTRQWALRASPDGTAVIVAGDDYVPDRGVERAIVVAFAPL